MTPFPAETELQDHIRYVGPISEYESEASRIAGYKRVISFPGHAPTPMFVVGHEVFDEYTKTGSIDGEAKEQVLSAFRQIQEHNSQRGVFIGRGFFVPGMENPNGPRTAAIRDENEFLQTVEMFYQYATEQGYNIDSADMALVLHPFIDATEKRLTYAGMKVDEQEFLPWTGGYIVSDSVPGAEERVKIGALYGSDEATQSLSHDTYMVDPQRQKIVNKEVVLKQRSYVSRTGTDYEIVQIPQRFQLEQALTDEELLFIASEAQKVFHKYPDSRIEFIVQSDGVYFREIAPWQRDPEEDLLTIKRGEEITSSVVRVNSPEDVEKIKGPNAIVYFGPEAFRERSTDLFAWVAAKEGIQQLVALVYGTIETSHAARILHDAGYSIIHVGDAEYKNGTRVRVSQSEDGRALVEYLDPYEGAIVHLTDVKRLYRGDAGMKVARLAMMKVHDIPTPDGFGIRSEIIWKWLEKIGATPLIAQLDTIDTSKRRVLERICEIIQKKILKAEIPEALERQINEALAVYGFDRWMIRSSGSEDGKRRSLAGMYTSSQNVPTSEVMQKMKETIASYFSPAAIALVRHTGMLPYHMVIGLGVHEFIPEEEGGLGVVAFTYHDRIVFDITPGSPKGVVSGTAEERLHVEIQRENGGFGEITRSGSETVQLNDEAALSTASLVARIERVFNDYQDEEIMITPSRGTIVVQTRPR